MSHFLNTKSFHVNTFANQKRKWEAEQKAAHAERVARERADVLRKEREADERAALAGHARGAMAFMYQAPPGYLDSVERDRQRSKDAAKDSESSSDGADDKAGDEKKIKKPTTATELKKAHNLQNAPLAGEYAKDIAVTLQPFGKEVSTLFLFDIFCLIDIRSAM